MNSILLNKIFKKLNTQKAQQTNPKNPQNPKNLSQNFRTFPFLPSSPRSFSTPRWFRAPAHPRGWFLILFFSGFFPPNEGATSGICAPPDSLLAPHAPIMASPLLKRFYFFISLFSTPKFPLGRGKIEAKPKGKIQLFNFFRPLCRARMGREGK